MFGPLHVLLSGRTGEIDRRAGGGNAPSFGLIGKPLPMTVKVEDGPTRRPTAAPSPCATAGADSACRSRPRCQRRVRARHGGTTFFELEVEAGPRELTLDNNRTVVAQRRPRPPPRAADFRRAASGQRVWRNVLKSDPAVDLVHFTILRPPEKQDDTPIHELSLIAFPVRELFEEKLDQFDLIIFDRYSRRGVIPQAYLENVVRYVRNGGAFLEAAAPISARP